MPDANSQIGGAPVLGKVCRTCSCEKASSLFYRNSNARDGLQSSCKKCMDKAREDARKRDPERSRAKMRERSKRWANKNKERDRTRRKATLKKWKQANREDQLSYERYYRATRIANDPSFKLRVRLSSRLYAVLRSAGLRKHASTVRLLGCTPQEAKVHIERQFHKGMTWSNWGEVWHVDHIRPLAGFDLTDQEQRTQACHFTNLRPLPKAENMSKGAKALYLL